MFDDINDTVGIAEKIFSINFNKAQGKLYNVDSSYLFVNNKKNT